MARVTSRRATIYPTTAAMRELPRTAFYPGSFDPLTNGHLHIIRSTALLCDRLVVAIGVHATKQPLLSVQRRAEILRREAGEALHGSGCSLEVTTFTGLTVDAARAAGAAIMVRGLRSGADFDDEIVLAGMNAALAPDIQTVFVPASPATRHITATLVRQIAGMGGDVSAFVPERVRQALLETGVP